MWLFAQSITAQGDCVVLKVERKQFTVLVGKANTLLERNREMYDMVNHELMEVRNHFATALAHDARHECQEVRQSASIEHR